MKRSARSIPTGPGSRGGQWHDPEFRKAYFREWRKAHPAYREGERRRRLLTHAIARLTRVIAGGSYARPSMTYTDWTSGEPVEKRW